MLFQTSQFLGFFLVFYTLFLAVQRKPSTRNILLLIGSFYFYSVWDPRFILLLFAVTVIDFYLGKAIEDSQNQKHRKIWLIFSVVSNLSILAFFKYYDFFIHSVNPLFDHLGFGFELPFLKIALPVGVSFFTFESLSYIVDVYRGRQKAVRNFVEYGVFIAFFPHLVAGPIIRPHTFFPMLKRDTVIRESDFWSGVYRFCCGIFKKIIIADQLAAFAADEVFSTPQFYSSYDLMIAAYAYTFQIYLDFSGYSDMAIGISKMLGIELPENFEKPYLAKDMQDFWRRWHISLSTWLRDYLYIPLGGSKKGAFRKYVNVFITMLLGGLWHGANWTFVLWGAFHGFFITVSHILKDRGIGVANSLWASTVGRLVTFHLVVLSWIIFRSENFEKMGHYFHGLAKGTTESFLPKIIYIFLALAILLTLSGLFELKQKMNDRFMTAPYWVRYSTVAFAIMLILVFENHFKPFIYFQF